MLPLSLLPAVVLAAVVVRVLPAVVLAACCRTWSRVGMLPLSLLPAVVLAAVAALAKLVSLLCVQLSLLLLPPVGWQWLPASPNRWV